MGHVCIKSKFSEPSSTLSASGDVSLLQLEFLITYYYSVIILTTGTVNNRSKIENGIKYPDKQTNSFLYRKLSFNIIYKKEWHSFASRSSVNIHTVWNPTFSSVVDSLNAPY